MSESNGTFYLCPRCSQPAHRTHRRPLDRLASLVVPLRRYKCSRCGWSGLRVSASSTWAQRPKVMAIRVALIVIVLLLSLGIAMLLRL